MALVTFEDLPSTNTPINAANLNNNFQNLGKLLWSGNFTSGSITVPGLSNYRAVLMNVGGVFCYGRPSYGIGGIVAYYNTTITTYAYRLGVSGNTLTISDADKGGYSSDGTHQAIQEIYGLF